MLTPELLRLMFEYNQWADQRMLNACASLTNEQFTQNLGSSFGSVRDTLAHLYGAEWIWNERIHGRAPLAHPTASAFPDLPSVRSKLEEMDRYFIEFAARLSPQDLQRILRYKTQAGTEFSNPLWQTLHQVTNHATYHRGQVVTMLRQLGAKPTSTDLIGFYREKAASASA